jgi:hypothetical protein
MSADAGMSSRDYEREAEASRHRLAGNLRELSDRLTPGQVFDEVLTYAKGGGGTFLGALSNAAKDNPVPSLLISAGLLMFLSEKTGITHMLKDRSNGARRDDYPDSDGAMYRPSNGDYRSSNGDGIGRRVAGAAQAVGAGVKNAADQTVAGARRGARGLGSAVAGAAEGAQNAAAGIGAAASGVGAGLMSEADQLMYRAGEFGESVRQATNAAGERIVGTAQEAPRKVGESVNAAKDSLMSLASDQPLIVGAIGLALGAIIAAALPKTEVEDELMGETSDSLKKAVGALAAEEMETARNVASKVASDVASNLTQVMDSGGVSKDKAVEAVHDVAAKIKDAVGMPTSEDKEKKPGKSGMSRQT